MAAGLPCVRGFVGELNQIWGNLIDNALDAAPESGHIQVTATCEHNGCGSRGGRWTRHSAGLRERIFEPFFTTKPVGKGTGQGLDIVRRLLAHNDAHMDVESRPGRTEFAVALPIAEPAAPQGVRA